MCVTIASHSPAVVEDGQYFVVGQLPVLALADEGSERRRADLARADVELGLGGGGVVEVHPAPDVAPLEVALRPHARRQLYIAPRASPTVTLIIISFPSPTLSFIPDSKPSFSASASHCSFSFSSSVLTTRFSRPYRVCC